MNRVTRKYRIRNEHVRGSIGIVLIVNRVGKNRLKLFGHVIRKKETEAVRTNLKEEEKD